MSDETGAITAEGAAEGAEPSEETSIEAMLGEAWDAAEQDVDGASGDSSAQASDAQAGSAGAEVEAAGASGDAAQSLQAPEHWDSPARDLFAKQPPEVQQWMLDREKATTADYTRKTQEIAPWREAAGRWQQYADRAGHRNVHGAIDSMFRADEILRFGTDAQRAEMLGKLATSHGYKLVPDNGAAAGAGQQQQDTGEEDALGIEIKRHLDPAIGPIMQKLEELGGRFALDERTRAQSEYNRVQQEVDAFRDAKDEQGNLRHPHYVAVEGEMAVLAQAERSSGRTPQLADLYERAVWMVPAVRDKLIAARNGEAQQAARARTEAARTASSSVADGGGGAATRGRQPLSLEQELSAAYDAVVGAM